eukprot:jgi/Mesvir1/11944/Mv00275-RA.1
MKHEETKSPVKTSDGCPVPGCKVQVLPRDLARHMEAALSQHMALLSSYMEKLREQGLKRKREIGVKTDEVKANVLALQDHVGMLEAKLVESEAQLGALEMRLGKHSAEDDVGRKGKSRADTAVTCRNKLRSVIIRGDNQPSSVMRDGIIVSLSSSPLVPPAAGVCHTNSAQEPQL